MHFSEIEEFCGERGQFWDIYLTWNTTGSPDFPECFQKTALSWIPCLILFLLSPVEIYILYHGRRGQIPWTILNITKMTLCLILAMLSLVNVINSAILRSRDIFVPKVDFFTPSLHFFTFVLIFGFTLMEKRKGIQSSGVQFFVFLVWTVLELLIYRSYILKASDEVCVSSS